MGSIGLESEARRSLEFLDPTPNSIHKWPGKRVLATCSSPDDSSSLAGLAANWLAGWLAGNGARDAIVEVCQLAVSCCSCRDGGHRRSRRMGLAALDEQAGE